MLDSERARLLEGINRVLEDMIGRGTGFLRRVASGRYIAVVEERQLEQFAKRGYDVLDKISTRIVNEVKGINRICYDITSKPPATIEWE